MSEGDRSNPETRPELPWGEKVVQLHDQLECRGIPYAFGGAIALNYHREPRSTLDIDVNVFLDPRDEDEVLAALDDLFTLPDPDRTRAELRDEGQARTLWGATYVDLFFANTDFHDAMAERIVREPFGDVAIPVLSIEDLLVCKILFDRPKDWVDIDAVVRTRGNQLDVDHVRHWLQRFVPAGDPRFARLEQTLAAPE